MSRCFEVISPEQFQKDFSAGTCASCDTIMLPKRATARSAGYDIFSPVSFVLQPGESKVVPTGLKVQMPDNEHLDIRVRSSMGFKKNVRLKNQLGLVDADYYNNEGNEGHIFVAIQNEGDKTLRVVTGDAIAQGTFIQHLLVDGDWYGEGEARTGGIGSTSSKDD